METVFITGCSSGFGKITAEMLAKKGHQIIAGIRDVETANRKVAEEMSKVENIKVVELDLSSIDSISKAGGTTYTGTLTPLRSKASLV